VNGDDGRGDLDCLNRVFEALKLLEGDALGGSGSRGYGQVRFTKLTVDGVDVQARFDALEPVDKDRAQVVVAD